MSVVDYGQATDEKAKKTWLQKFEEKALEKAKDFVKKNATTLQKTIVKAVIEDTTISRAKDVLVTYACVDPAGNVIATRVKQFEDKDAMHWWSGGKLDEGHEAEKHNALGRNRPPPIFQKPK